MKTIIPAIVLLFLSLNQSTAQSDNWTLKTSPGEEISNVSFHRLEGDSLTIVQSGIERTIHVGLISWVEQHNNSSKVVNPMIGGLGLGAGLGFMVGTIIDANNSSGGPTSSNAGNNSMKTILTVAGGVVGLGIGAGLGSSARHHSYDLKSYTVEQKRTFFSSFIPVPESVAQVETQHGNIVYLKNGSVIKGTIVELMPDSIIRIQTADSSLFVFEMSDVQKITKNASSISVPTNTGRIELMGSSASASTSFGTKGTTELGGYFSYQHVTPVIDGSSEPSEDLLQIMPFIGHFVADGLEVGVNPFGITSLGGSGDATEVLLLGSVSYNVRSQSKSTPFLEGLLGYSSESSGEGSSASGLSWGFRGGIKYALTDKGLLNLSLEYLEVTTNPNGATNRYGTDQLSLAIGYTVWL